MSGSAKSISLAALALTILAAAAEARPPSRPINDAEFERALPPLEATQPLAPAPPIAPAPPPPASDSELTAPLTPLGSFNETPPVTVAEQPSEKARPLHYRVEVDGLRAVDLEDRFHELSALIQDGSKAANAAQIRARAQEDVDLAERLMKSQGYYDGSATFAMEPVKGEPDRRIVTITAVPGKRYDFGSIAVTGAAPEPTRLARKALTLKSGDPIVAADVQSAEANVSLRLPQQGYPFAKVGQRDILLDDSDDTGDYSLPVDAGHKARFGAIRTKGDDVFSVKHIDVLRRFKPGAIYDSRLANDLHEAMVATQLFRSASVEPVHTGEINPDGTETVDLLVRQHRGPSHSLAASIGYATGEGIKGTASWTLRNLFPPEGALILEAVGGTQEQSLSATFRRSNAGLRDRTFQAGLSLSHVNQDAFTAKTATLSASLARVSTPIWQKRWTYSIGAELDASDESKSDPDTGQRTHHLYYIAALPLQLGYDRSNSLLDPTRGFRVTLHLSPEASVQNGAHGYVRGLLETSGYLPITDGLTLAARVRLGSIVGASRDTIPASRRLYAGGGGSVRGYGYQQLGPKDADNKPIGGRSLNEFAIEARYRFGDFGIVPFFDGGQVYDSSLPNFGHMRYGVGIGGRYYTSLGPFRLDVATPIARQPGEARIAVYLSIGQAF